MGSQRPQSPTQGPGGPNGGPSCAFVHQLTPCPAASTGGRTYEGPAPTQGAPGSQRPPNAVAHRNPRPGQGTPGPRVCTASSRALRRGGWKSSPAGIRLLFFVRLPRPLRPASHRRQRTLPPPLPAPGSRPTLSPPALPFHVTPRSAVPAATSSVADAQPFPVPRSHFHLPRPGTSFLPTFPQTRLPPAALGDAPRVLPPSYARGTRAFSTEPVLAAPAPSRPSGFCALRLPCPWCPLPMTTCSPDRDAPRPEPPPC